MLIKLCPWMPEGNPSSSDESDDTTDESTDLEFQSHIGYSLKQREVEQTSGDDPDGVAEIGSSVGPAVAGSRSTRYPVRSCRGQRPERFGNSDV